jgi:23S rRNA pseudouridine1911/1915/1917 synthase
MSIDQEIDPIESEDDLFEHFNFIVDKGQQLLRIDKYLLLKIANSSRSKIQTGIEAGAVKVNNQPIKSNYKVKPFDDISVSFSTPPRDHEVIAENIPINIVYEDSELMIINKEPNMVVHPAHGNWTGTLVNGLLYYCQNLPGNSNIRPGLVHRIDKDTSGLLVIGKTEIAMSNLASQFFNHTVERTYYAILWGVPKVSKGTLRGNITRHPKDRKIMYMLPEESEDGKLFWWARSSYHQQPHGAHGGASALGGSQGPAAPSRFSDSDRQQISDRWLQQVDPGLETQGLAHGFRQSSAEPRSLGAARPSPVGRRAPHPCEGP